MDVKYKTTVVATPADLACLIRIASESTYHEYDCDRDTYLNHIIRNVYQSDVYRAVLLSFGNEVVGYFISWMNNHLYKDITVVDVFIKKEHQGRECFQLFIEDLGTVMYKVGAKRIKWHSHVFGEDFWLKHSFSLPIKTYKMFFVELEGTKKAFQIACEKMKERF